MYLLINKPAGPTSHDVVNRLRHITGIKKIGHAGTLDPFASGLLIIAISRESTREIDKFVKLDKEYIATIKLGAVSDTYDRTGKIEIRNRKSEIVFAPPARGGDAIASPALSGTPAMAEGVGAFTISNFPKLKNIKKILKSLLGKQLQTPPMYSAKKINGQKLYELARLGKEVARPASKIEIKKIKILDYQFPFLKIKVACSSGTYIRSLANDVGEKLKTGAYLEELERTKIGKYKIKKSVSLEKLTLDNWKNFTF